jgi:hypothetical protein
MNFGRELSRYRLREVTAEAMRICRVEVKEGRSERLERPREADAGGQPTTRLVRFSDPRPA